MEQCKLIDFDMEHPLRRNYIRNKNLIDLSMIPIDLKQKVIEEYNNSPVRDRSMLVGYFSKNKLKTLLENVNDF